MIKLVDLLKEIELGEAIVKVPQAALAKSKEAFNYIKSNLERFKAQSPKDYDQPYIDSKFKDYFKLKDLKNEDLLVSIGFYNDPENVGAGAMDTINDNLLINLAYFNPEDFPFFIDLIEHELVHAMDPKVRDKKIFNAINIKKGNFNASTSKSEFESDKYYKLSYEFDSFTSTLVNTIKFNLQKLPDPNQKSEYIKLIKDLLSDIKTKSIEQIMSDSKYTQLAWFFSKQKWDAGNWDAVWKAYSNDLNKIKAWVSKPTLYQRFTKRLATVLG
jgi:hypothetical protein